MFRLNENKLGYVKQFRNMLYIFVIRFKYIVNGTLCTSLKLKNQTVQTYSLAAFIKNNPWILDFKDIDSTIPFRNEYHYSTATDCIMDRLKYRGGQKTVTPTRIASFCTNLLNNVLEMN